MNVWIDLDNSPAALLFAPISQRLTELGHEVVVTARDNAQTVPLGRERWSDLAVIGEPAPPRRLAKVGATIRRVNDLRKWARARRPDVALSHNSYAQIVGARSLRMPCVTAMDYEHHPVNHLAFRLANRVLLPDAMRSIDVGRLGATPRKTTFYPGLKEEIYLGDFEPDPEILRRVGIGSGDERAVVVARTPPSRATYHQFENPLFVDALRLAAAQPETVLVVLSRYPEQRQMLADMRLENCIVPDTAIDSRSLMHAADVMIGAGGTMTREAALLGVPTYGLYAGRSPAVDRYLEENGLLIRLDDPQQLLPIRRREQRTLDLEQLRRSGHQLVELFVEAVIGAGAKP